MALNVLVTYGRSYGVLGVVGATLGLVDVVNSMLSFGVSCCFEFSVGKARTTRYSGFVIEESCGWFNVTSEYVIKTFV